MMIQKTNSKKNLKKSNGNVHVNDEIKIKDNSEIKGIKRKLTKKADNNESKNKKINKKNNSAEESNEVFEESTTNLSPKKGKKAKFVGTSVLKEDVHAGDSDDEQVKGISGFQEEEPDKNEDANHHNNVQIKKSVVCLACGDNGHQTANCSLLEGMEVVECCSKCLSPDHASDGCSEVQVYTRFNNCRNCQDPNHYSSNCENECKWCKNNTDGHIRKDCPMADLCRNCEESKHPSWACEKKCKYCSDNFDGHVRKDCPLGVSKFRERDLGRGSSRGGGFRGRSSRGGGFRGRGSSGGGGFRGRGSSRGGGFGGSSCFNCNEVGHMSRVCPKRGF